MNRADEQRVLDALQTLTGGLTVTEQDTLSSHAELNARLSGAASPGPRRPLALALAAAAVLVVGTLALVRSTDDGEPAPAPATPPTPAEELRAALTSDAYGLPREGFLAGRAPTRTDLAGLWAIREPHSLPMLADSRGNFVVGLANDPGVAGTYTLKGRSLTWHRTAQGFCDSTGREDSRWQAAIADDGSLRLAFAGSGSICSAGDDREVWDRVLPGPSPLATFLQDSVPRLEWEPSTGMSEAVYADPGTGWVLDVASTGDYTVFTRADGFASDDAVAGTGRIRGSNLGTLYATCDEGILEGGLEEAVIPAVEGITPAMTTYRLSDVQGSCTGGLANDAVWVRVD